MDDISVIRGDSLARMAGRARRRSGKSQRTVHREIGMARDSISRAESGRHEILLSTWNRLIEASGYEVILVRKGEKVCVSSV